MFESLLFNAEKNNYYFRLIFISFLITFILSVVNYFIGANSLFLVALISLALSYPIVNYIRSMDKEELEFQMKSKLLIFRHQKELIVFWAIFLGVLFGLIASSFLISDFTYQQAFISKISGDVTQNNKSFTEIYYFV